MNLKKNKIHKIGILDLCCTTKPRCTLVGCCSLASHFEYVSDGTETGGHQGHQIDALCLSLNAARVTTAVKACSQHTN